MWHDKDISTFLVTNYKIVLIVGLVVCDLCKFIAKVHFRLQAIKFYHTLPELTKLKY